MSDSVNVREKLEEKGLTFEINSETHETKKFEDGETLLLTLNLSYHSKTTAKALREYLIKCSEKEFSAPASALEDTDGILTKDYSLFYLMMEAFINFLSCDYTENMSKKKKDELIEALSCSEQTDIINTLSWREHRDNIVKIERVPSNLSMMTCNCCMSKEMTSDKNDFSRDVVETEETMKKSKKKDKEDCCKPIDKRKKVVYL